MGEHTEIARHRKKKYVPIYDWNHINKTTAAGTTTDKCLIAFISNGLRKSKLLSSVPSHTLLVSQWHL